MKNLKISAKLRISFVLVILFALVLTIVGVVGMSEINAADDALYNQNLIAVEEMGQISTNFANQEKFLREVMLFTPDSEEYKGAQAEMEELDMSMQSHMQAYQATITEDIDQQQFDEFKKFYNEDFRDGLVVDAVTTASGSDYTGAITLLNEAKPNLERMNTILNDSITFNTAAAKESLDANTRLYKQNIIVQAIVLVLAIIFTQFISAVLTRWIARPINEMTTVLTQLGTTGNLTLAPETQSKLASYSGGKDEIAAISRSLTKMLAHMKLVSEELEIVASGDLTQEIGTLSNEDVLGISLVSMQENLNRRFSEINISTVEVSNGATQMAQASQNLSQGSTEQAASIEKLSETISRVYTQTQENSKAAQNTSAMTVKAADLMSDGMRSMNEMLTSMAGISEASANIAKIIKVIDDIAFQTNILALNAAVEAARAGQHGKGFAVVADEVRNLAAKSAAAAKETSELIEGSTQRVREGNEIVTKTNESLRAVADISTKSSEAINEIAEASREQEKSLAEITSGVEQISAVVQTNTATAEETAASSEEMSSQAQILQSIVSRFRLKNVSVTADSMNTNAYTPREAAAPAAQSTGMSMGTDKY